MRIVIAISLLCSLSISLAQAESLFENIEKERLIMEGHLQKAQDCLPEQQPGGLVFCTGVRFSQSYIKQLTAMSLGACRKEIQKKGYTVVREGQEATVDASLWRSFYQSTKFAETIHNDKLVFLKKTANRNDCIHELIHVHQWMAPALSPLAPAKRTKQMQKMKEFFAPAIAEIEALEKAGKKQAALKKGAVVQAGIDAIKAYEGMFYWLDEKDAHYFFYLFCDQGFRCKGKDWDTVLANLFQLKPYLPWRARNAITRKAIASVKAKERRAFRKLRFKPLDKKQKQRTKQLFSVSWEELFATIMKAGIRVVRYENPANKKQGKDFGNAIPPLEYQKIPKAADKDLLQLIQFSKITKGAALGKYFCRARKNKVTEPTILLTSFSTRATVIHEYLHHLQALKNPKVCIALTEQDKIAKAFKRGEITRKTYEAKILQSKLFLWLMEHEVYAYMMGHVEQFSALEASNTKINYLLYAARLVTLKQKKFKRTTTNIERIPWSIKNELPTVSVADAPLVLDLGAMQTTIRPDAIFANVSVSKILPQKLVTLRNALGQTIEAPVVTLDKPIPVAGTPVQKTQVALANLKIPNIEGVLGLDFLQGKDFILDIQKKELQVASVMPRKKYHFPLQRDFNGSIRAVEFVCPSKMVIRLDSGSQVLGDLSQKAPAKVREAFINKKSAFCGDLKIKGPLETNIQNKALFDRGVSINLGWPWMKQFKQIEISLSKGFVNFIP